MEGAEAKAEVISDDELMSAVVGIISEHKSDLSAITKKIVRGLLEKQFSLCEGALDGRRSEINAYIESAIEACDAEEELGEGSDQEEQGAKKKRLTQLRAVIGDGDVSRDDIIHRMWKYIKAHNLQDPSDKRFILCDAALKQIFKSGRVSMFKMNKELTRLLWKPEKDESPPRPASAAEVKETPSKTPEKSISKKATSSKASAAAKDKKKPKTSACSSDEPKKLNGLQQPRPLSTKLADFMGIQQASQSDVFKKIWEHIKSNNLQSADNKSIINCDTQLEHLLGQSTCSSFSLHKYIGPHFLKIANGWGKYEYDDGGTHEGEWIDDMKHGRGFSSFAVDGKTSLPGRTYSWSAGDKCDGEWCNGQRHGVFRYTFFNGETLNCTWEHDRCSEFTARQRAILGAPINGSGKVKLPEGEYEGEWRGWTRHGRGVFRDGSGAYDGEWSDDMKHGMGKCVYADGGMYEGEWIENRKHGRGKYTYADGGTYEGEWSDDMKHGKGKYTYDDEIGGTYEGEWSDDTQNGNGKFTYADGGMYEGEWSKNRKHGRGKYTYADGGTYEGEWSENNKHGRGFSSFAVDGKTSLPGRTYSWSAGDKCDGEWCNGQRHGVFRYTFFNGETLNCTWADGRCSEFTARQRNVLVISAEAAAVGYNVLQISVTAGYTSKAELRALILSMGFQACHVDIALQSGCVDADGCIDYIQKLQREADAKISAEANAAAEAQAAVGAQAAVEAQATAETRAAVETRAAAEMRVQLNRLINQDPDLDVLRLSVSNLNDTDAFVIASALQRNSTLRELDLSQNCICDSGASALARAIQLNSTLQQLNLRMNSIGPDGGAQLAASCYLNTTLLGLNLRYNKIGKLSGQLFADAILFNRTLLTLDINFNGASTECLGRIYDLLERNNQSKTKSIVAVNIPKVVLADVSPIAHVKELRGGNGVVRQVIFNGRLAAMKQPNSVQSMNQRDRAKFMKELDITYRVRHPACVLMYGACIDEDNMFLLMEWMEGGSLFDALGNHVFRPLPSRQRVSIARDIADGLNYLHMSGIIHRDIKSLNVLLSKENRAKLCDFGLATLHMLTTTTSTASGRQAPGTYAWSAPEVMIDGEKHTEKSDVYSLGIIMWELLTCEVPFSDCDYAQIMARSMQAHTPTDRYNSAMPDPAMQPLLQSIVERVERLARGAQFTSEMTTHGLTLLEAYCICAYTCDAREFGNLREDSPFFIYNKALRDGNLEAVAQWRDFSVLFGLGLRKLPALTCTVYRGLDCPLTEVSHLYAEGSFVWHNSVTSTTTDKYATLATFGTGASGNAGTFIEIRVRNGRKIMAFSAFPSEEELLLPPNTCTKVLVTLSSAKVALLQGFAALPPNVDLIVLQEDS